MNKNHVLCILVTILFFFSSNVTFAYRPSPSPFSRCQEFLQRLVSFTDEETDISKKFPPDFLRYASETGIIDSEVFLEQAIRKTKHVPYWQKDCQYAIAPWARFKDLNKGHPTDIYCVKHGFLESVYPDRQNKKLNAEQIRNFFLNKCRDYGIDEKTAIKQTQQFDPDPDNIGQMGILRKNFLKLYQQIGFVGFLLIHLALTLGIWIIFLPLKDNNSLIATAGMWLGIESIYMVPFFSIFLDGWGSRYIRFPGEIIGVMTAAHLILILFSFVMIFVQKANKEPLSPTIILLFASFIGILGINIISTLLGFYIFFLVRAQYRK